VSVGTGDSFQTINAQYLQTTGSLLLEFLLQVLLELPSVRQASEFIEPRLAVKLVLILQAGIESNQNKSRDQQHGKAKAQLQLRQPTDLVERGLPALLCPGTDFFPPHGEHGLHFVNHTLGAGQMLAQHIPIAPGTFRHFQIKKVGL